MDSCLRARSHLDGDRLKARKPVVNGQLLRFVRFGADALTQGVINTRIDGVPVRVDSVAKTVADCLKYRKRIRPNLAQLALEECIVHRKCSIERLRHFAKICRVAKLVQAAYSSPPRATPPKVDVMPSQSSVKHALERSLADCHNEKRACLGRGRHPVQIR